MQLETINLTKKYSNVTALDSFTQCFNTGIWGLLGPNGSGKTTLLNLITSNIQKNDGSICWNGVDIDSLGAKYREILGYLPQTHGFYKNFTARMFMQYMSVLKDVYPSRSERKQRNEHIDKLLDTVNLLDVANKRVGTFSAGMKQRLGIAQAMLNNPSLLTLDEPTAGLDPQERINLKKTISLIAKDSVVIWATHIITDLEFIAKEIILLKKGKCIKKGTAKELINSVTKKVWTLTLSLENAKEHIEEFTVSGTISISNIFEDNESVTIRMLSESSPHENAALCKPNLEEMYLYYHDEGTAI
ncbi:MAG: ATP-binding cassette domain-containing protein [Oscillospiraceae bacterium]|jgi:ABC-type multidrug transport system ATPase subunit|nr:ATP-binding cassette domain-containing protein [Oscillospiraceae bacterium]